MSWDWSVPTDEFVRRIVANNEPVVLTGGPAAAWEAAREFSGPRGCANLAELVPGVLHGLRSFRTTEATLQNLFKGSIDSASGAFARLCRAEIAAAAAAAVAVPPNDPKHSTEASLSGVHADSAVVAKGVSAPVANIGRGGSGDGKKQSHLLGRPQKGSSDGNHFYFNGDINGAGLEPLTNLLGGDNPALNLTVFNPDL
jgi:hypothetical protein